MKRVIFLFATITLMVAAAYSQVAVGSKIDNFSVPDTDGKMRSLEDVRGKNGAVLIFISAECPVVRGYDQRMNELSKAYKAKGINVIGIDSNVTESLDQVKTHAATTWDFPVLIDKGFVVADKLGANVTPEAYYLDANNVLLYHGAIDNDRSGRNVTERFLQTAFESALAGKKIERSSANAFGCSIKRAVE
ncbi:MAG TPA: redoxin domain-containing protein [Pyrinomonadaceae bacterium]|jgi:peroxiredoxin|nr:redoxin domain-containing protein [Pyrinomonadaceae bacterium]